MFFFLSKILAFLLSPLVWFFILIALAVWKIKEPKKRRRTAIIAFVILYLSSNSFFVDECMRKWEYTTPDLQPYEHFDYAIVLGGMIRYDERLDKPQFMRGADRILQTIELLQRRQLKRIILTGGSGSILHPEHKESFFVKRYLVNIGIPDTCIIIDNESRNTRENAINTKHLLDSLDVHSTMLFVTSAFHMRRGLGCFRKLGVNNLRAYPTDRYSGPRKWEFDHLFIPNPEALDTFTLLLHEMAGYLVYKMRGFC